MATTIPLPENSIQRDFYYRLIKYLVGYEQIDRESGEILSTASISAHNWYKVGQIAGAAMKGTFLLDRVEKPPVFLSKAPVDIELVISGFISEVVSGAPISTEQISEFTSTLQKGISTACNLSLEAAASFDLRNASRSQLFTIDNHFSSVAGVRYVADLVCRIEDNPATMMLVDDALSAIYPHLT